MDAADSVLSRPIERGLQSSPLPFHGTDFLWASEPTSGYIQCSWMPAPIKSPWSHECARVSLTVSSPTNILTGLLARAMDLPHGLRLTFASCNRIPPTALKKMPAQCHDMSPTPNDGHRVRGTAPRKLARLSFSVPVVPKQQRQSAGRQHLRFIAAMSEGP